MKLCLHICNLHHFLYLFICHLLICNISFFPFLLLHFLRKCRLNYTHELYTHTLFIIVSYFVNTFYCTNCMFLHEIFSVFQLTFSCFHHNVHLYTFTQVVQSTGDIVQYLLMGICLHLQRYNFWEICVVMMKLM